jgi:hypothetical protein
MVNRAPPEQHDHRKYSQLGTFSYSYLLSPAQILCLFKAIARVCTPKRTKGGPSAYFASWLWHALGCVINPLSLSFTVSLYLVYQGERLDLTCGSPGVWSWEL